MIDECMDIASLRTFVEREIERFKYVYPENAIGDPLPDASIEEDLVEFKAALVEPKWVKIHICDTSEQWEADPPIIRDCVLIADDLKGYQIYFDPEENNFVLASPGDPPETFCVRGDAVGCFMAR